MLGEGLELFDNTAIYGGAIYLLIECQMSITAFHAYNNSATVQGGLLMASGLVEVYMQYGRIEGHKASYGAVIDASTEGVLIHIMDSTILNNKAMRDGGVVRISDLAVVYMENVSMSENSAEFGGVVVAATATALFKSCQVFDNYASDSGGAFHCSYANITFVKSTFEENAAAEYGGVISIESTSILYVVDCALHHNFAGESGGVAFLSDDSNARFVKSSCTSNGVIALGGVIYAEKRGLFDFVECIFEGNYANSAAVIYATTDSDIAVSSSLFHDNHATSVTDGGAMHFVKIHSLLVEECVFSNSTGGFGAAIQVDQLGNGALPQRRTSVVIDGALDSVTPLADEFDENERRHLTDSTYRVKIYGTIFAHNSFEYNSVDFKLEDVCGGEVNGGAVYFRDLPSIALVTNSTFRGNVACYGAGLYSSSSKVAVRDSVFDSNMALHGGGGIFWKVISLNEETVTMENVVDLNNVAPYGPLVATNMCKLQVQQHGLESSGTKFQNPVKIHMQVCISGTRHHIYAIVDTHIYHIIGLLRTNGGQ